MFRVCIISLSATIILTSWACSSDNKSEECTPGEEKCTCTEQGTCNGNLVCASNICVDAESAIGKKDTGSVTEEDTQNEQTTETATENDNDSEEKEDTGSDAPERESDTKSDTGSETGDGDDSEPIHETETETVDDFNTDNICETIELNAASIPNRVMILQDLSSSLKQQGRWDQLKAAMIQVLEAYEDELAWGIVPFATTVLDGGRNDADCTVNTDHIISPQIGNEEAIRNKVYTLVADDLVGGTPTYDAMLAGRDVLVDDDPNDGSDRYMILVTDGLPNCLDGDGGGASTDEDVARVTEAIPSLHEDNNITIFTVGYDLNGSALETMDTWANLGGTGSAYPAEDTTSLLAQMEAITDTLISCDYELDAKVADPSYVRVQIDGESKRYDDPDGWRLNDERDTISLQGDACSTLQDGEVHSISVQVECEIVII